MYPHRIRLRGPWDCELIDAERRTPRRVLMPCRWADAGLAGIRGPARFSRKFGYPGKADPDLEHIWLICDGCTGCREIHLNGFRLAESADESFAFDVSRLLAARNQLDVTIQGNGDECGLWGDVFLEIRKDAYIHNARAERAGQGLVVTGQVIGAAPAALELYTLVDGRHADYRVIAPSEAGTSFRIELADVPSGAETVRVELIHISEVWYVVELPISGWHA